MPSSSRTTNNSASSLEEQTEIIREVTEKGVKSSTSSDGGEKKKVKKKQTSSASVLTVQTTASMTVSAPVTVTAVSTAQPILTTAAQGAPPLVPPYHMPMYFPPQLGYQGFYPPFLPQFSPDVESHWEQESVSSCVRQEGHEISDEDEGEEEEEEGVIEIAPIVERPPEKVVDFGSLKDGKFADLLKSQSKKVRDEDRMSPAINQVLANSINDFFEETKLSGELERLSKEYPRIENVEAQVVPKLDVEVFNAIDQGVKNADIAMQSLQKGLVAAVSAMAPVGSLLIARGNSDPELEALAAGVFDAFHLVAMVSNGMSIRRREQLKPFLQQTYAKSMAKAPEGSSKWLFGGNLSETARKCEVSKKISEKLVKSKNPQQKGNANNNNNSHQQKRGGGAFRQNKRFKYTNNASWQDGYYKQPFQPKQFGYQAFQPYYQVPQHYQPRAPNPRQEASGAQQKQDFQPRGARK